MGHVVDPTEGRFQGISDSSLVEARLNAQQVAQRARRKLQSAHERARCKLDSDLTAATTSCARSGSASATTSGT